MEDALATSPVAPPPATLAAAAVLTRRRSHLDSASYRTLSRLFSHCLHLHPSPREGTAPPEADPAAVNPTGGDSGDDSPQVPRGADFDRLKDLEKEAVDAEGPSLHGTVWPAREQPPAANPTRDPCEAEAPQRSNDDVDEVVAVESTRDNTDAGVKESGIRAGMVVDEDDALKLVTACLETTEVDESVEGALGNDDGQLLLDTMMTNFTGLIDDVGAGMIPAQACVVSGGELQNSKASEDSKQSGGGIEDGEPVSNLDRELNNDGGFEEGEIEGEFQDLDSEESGDSELGDDDDAEDEKLGGDSVSRGSGANESCDHGTQFGNLHLTPEIIGNGHLTLNKDANVRGDAQISVSRAQAVSYDEVVDWNGTPLPDNEAPNPGKKRKRSVTEERKAKKTKNKRKKRAQQRIADGVKRPKLQHVIKPKKPCHFYDHGKCQQGDKCKFSHDFTPSTKSKPCKHFACGSCLKGDDCPYDHELSKYECHNYKNNGMCIRGDRCKFSHVMRTVEGTPTQDAKPSDASLAYEKTNLREHTSSQKTSTVHNGEPVTSAPTKQQCSILKNLAGFSINSQNVSNRIPKGVQFLPFDKGGSNLSSLHLDTLSIEKPRNANATQHQYLGGHEAERQKIAKQNGQESLLDEKNSSNEATLHPFSDPKKASLPINSTATSVHTQHEVSEASRILQEFLFGADN